MTPKTFMISIINKLKNKQTDSNAPLGQMIEETHDAIIAGFDSISSDLEGKEDSSNKVTSLSASSTDTQYPSAKCVYDMIGDVESVLASLL